MHFTPTNLSWLTPRIQRGASFDLASIGEIPRQMIEMSTNHSHFDSSLEEKIIAEGKQLLFQETGLIQREASIIQHRLNGSRRVNLLDLGSTNGFTSLPFLYELATSDDLNSYIPVTPNPSVNLHAIRKIEAFFRSCRLPVLQSTHLVIDPQIRNFHTELSQINRQSGEETINLMLLNSSVLGNYIYPERVLQNIYTSMNSGDFLAIVQGLYHPGSEDALIRDYNKVVEYMWDTQSICQTINPDFELDVKWDEQFVKGIKVSFKIGKPARFAGVDLLSDQEITVFRSTRFERYDLEKTIRRIGYKMIMITLDETEDNGLFLLQK